MLGLAAMLTVSEAMPTHHHGAANTTRGVEKFLWGFCGACNDFLPLSTASRATVAHPNLVQGFEFTSQLQTLRLRGRFW